MISGGVPEETNSRVAYLGPGSHVERKSRKQRRCDGCDAAIEVGQTYVRHALPPLTEPLNTPGWKVMSMCGWTTGDCRKYWNLDAKELAGERVEFPV